MESDATTEYAVSVHRERTAHYSAIRHADYEQAVVHSSDTVQLWQQYARERRAAPRTTF